jgi:hypothetical protein|tara:strand:- start:796 stop:1056 length:261 start_codon:yes stop_codon:yes gene_type:complete
LESIEESLAEPCRCSIAEVATLLGQVLQSAVRFAVKRIITPDANRVGGVVAKSSLDSVGIKSVALPEADFGNTEAFAGVCKPRTAF